MKLFLTGLIAGLLIATSFSYLYESPEVMSKGSAECNSTEAVKEKIVVQQCDESIEQINTEKIEKAFLLFLASIGIKKD